MLVTFRTRAHANITLFGDVAIRLLGLMGHSGTVPSALAADDVPQALRRLRAAVDQEDDGDVDASDPDQPHVSLRQRAFPLIELLEAAARDQVPVTWDD